MAITRTPTDTDLSLVVTNGDLEALREIVERLGFADEESVLRYALAILAQAATRSVTITNRAGEKITLNPGQSLVKTDTEA